MIYDVRQTTIYHYASPVAYSRHVLRLTPIDRPGQRVHATALDIDPAPIERREGHDFFGNRMTWIELDEPHDTLSVRVAARVAVKSEAPPPAGRTPPWEEHSRCRVRFDRSVAELAGALPVSQPAGFARSGNPRLCRRELYAGAAGSRRRRRSHAADQGRLRLRGRQPPPHRRHRRCRSRCVAASARTSPTS